MFRMASQAPVATVQPGGGKAKTWRDSGFAFCAKRDGAVPTQAALLLGLHTAGPPNGFWENWPLSGSCKLRGLWLTSLCREDPGTGERLSLGLQAIASFN